MMCPLDSKPTEPRVLVVSNNAFSDTRNNGKTLASFFSSFDGENVAQLYFSDETPSGASAETYFRITDTDVLRSVFRRHRFCGGLVTGSEPNDNTVSRQSPFWVHRLRNSQLVRLVRELFWCVGRWNSPELRSWVRNFAPDALFFCAGDSEFAYRVVETIRRDTGAALMVYVTDDYVLPRKTLNPFWWIRRNRILARMRLAVSESALFVTISNKMRDTYSEYIGKDSILAVNMSDSLRDEKVQPANGRLTLVYAGGLHFKRYETLGWLSAAIHRRNLRATGQPAILQIYATDPPSEAVRRQMCVEGASSFCGSLNTAELKKILNACDIPVHVESFDRKCIESTRLSLSTKIPEYLSLGKPVLAIGPAEVASMVYLRDIACCITEPQGIDHDLDRLIRDTEWQIRLGERARQQYERYHRKEYQSENLKKQILKVIAR